MDLMKHLFDSVLISGAEGWSDLEDIMILAATEDLINDSDDSDDSSESRQNVPLPSQETSSVTSSSNRLRANRKRPRAVHAGQHLADVIRDGIQSRNQILSRTIQLIESHPDFSCSQLRAMQVLHSVPSIRMWSPLYKAAIQHLKESSANRQTFMFYEDDENKVLYLEFATGESRDA